MALTLFDLDETLLPLDSDYLWSTFMVEKGYINDQNFLVQKNFYKQEYISGTLDIHAYVAFMTKYLNRLGHHRHRYQKEFIHEIIKPNISPESLNLVEHHKQAGNYTVIITATNEFIVNDIASLFPIDHLIATELETEPYSNNGEVTYTGKCKGIPSFREGKVARIENFIKENPCYNFKGSFFYSDSINDIPLLERVDYPKAVNPDSRLKEYAESKGWEIINLH